MLIAPIQTALAGEKKKEESKMAASGGLEFRYSTFMLFLKYIFLQIICC